VQAGTLGINESRSEHTVAVRIRLLRMGKIRNPQYRIVVADSRTKRDGRAIEQLGLYHPKEDPSRIEVNSERVQHWLSVGAQPSVPVVAILSRTGDWQKFKGLPPPAEPLKVAPARADRKAVYEAEAKAAAGLAEAEAKPKKEAPAKATRSARAKAEAPTETAPAEAAATPAPAEAPAEAAPAEAPAQAAASPAAEVASDAGAAAEPPAETRAETPATPGEESTGAGDTQG
jgi:small subunit ribosomal protein S16